MTAGRASAPVGVLVISGAVGVGKSTVAYEVSNQLQAAGIGHALLDSDELDRLFPVPTDQVELNEGNLRAVWTSFAERGATRLVLVGVLVDIEAELAWLRRAIPDSRCVVVRLVAPQATLADRVARREIGTGLEYHLGRSLMQAARIGSEQPRYDTHTVRTDGRSVVDVAGELLGLTGWLAADDLPARHVSDQATG